MNKHIIGFIIGLFSATILFLVYNIFDPRIKIPKHHVTVKLVLETDKSIDLIELKSSSSYQSIWMGSQKETLLVFPNIGEGEFSVSCIFSDSTIIYSSANYVESGYSPLLKITDDDINVLDF